MTTPNSTVDYVNEVTITRDNVRFFMVGCRFCTEYYLYHYSTFRTSHFYIYMSSILVTIHSDHFLTLYHFLRKLSLIFLNIFMYISYVYLVLDYRTRREGPIPTLLSLSSQAAAIKGLSNDGKCR